MTPEQCLLLVVLLQFIIMVVGAFWLVSRVYREGYDDAMVEMCTAQPEELKTILERWGKRLENG